MGCRKKVWRYKKKGCRKKVWSYKKKGVRKVNEMSPTRRPGPPGGAERRCLTVNEMSPAIKRANFFKKLYDFFYK